MASNLSASRINFYQHFLNRLPVGMAILHLQQRRGLPAWRLIGANSKALQLAGNSLDDFLHLPAIETCARDVLHCPEHLYREVLETGGFRILGHLRDDSTRGATSVYLASAHPLEHHCVAILFEDASAVNKTVHKLSEAESVLAHMCEAAQAIVWRAEPGTLKFTSVSQQARQILGYWTERWCNETNFWRNHAHPGDWRVVRGYCARAAAGKGEQRFDCRMIRSDGSTRWFRFHVKHLKHRSGRQELAGVMVDVTEHKCVESAARRLSGQIIRAQEQERRRISRDLHDSIGQYLTGLKCTLKSLLDDESCSRSARLKLHDCIKTVGMCIDEARSISQILHPPILDLLGLAAALRSHAEEFSRRSGVRVELELPESEHRFDSAVETALYRIAQECLANVQHHARCDLARLRLSCEPADILLEIEDQGVGMDPALFYSPPSDGKRHGIGLLKMKERVNELNGAMSIHSDSTGTMVRVRIPRSQSPSEPQTTTEPAIEELVSAG